jgi:hypothetical protein
VKSYRFAIALFISAALGVSAFTASASVVPDEQWHVYQSEWRNLTSSAFHSIAVIDQLPTIDTFSHLWAENLQTENWSRHECTNSADAQCANPQQYSYESILPVCKDGADVDCVDSIAATDTSGVSYAGTFKQYNLDKQPNNFISAPELNIPQNSNPSVWDIQNAQHDNGTSYLVDVGLKGSVDSHGKSTSQQSLFANIVPVSIHKNALATIPSCWPATASQTQAKHNDFFCTGSEGQYTSDSEPRCAAASGTQGDCFAPEPFPAGLKFSLKIRLKNEPIGWIHGRISSPSISIASGGTGMTLMTVEAAPVIVPIFSIDGSWASLTPKVKQWWQRDFANYITTPGGDGAGTESGSNPENPTQDIPGSVMFMNPHPYGDFSMSTIKILSSEVADKAVAAPSSWSFHTLDNLGSAATNSCISTGSGLKGIVTTNSTSYAEGAPTFQAGNLNYKVASLHYLKDGSVFHGTYDLIIRSDVARCLYKFNQAPISATISVLSEDGSSQVTSTSVNERAGWLYLSANGFTFSSPTVKIKLTQEAPLPAPSSTPVVTVTPTPAATVSPASKAPAKTTITCVKGKTTKKVTAVKPTCPAGYKKK